MSVVNKMLNDLDARSATEDGEEAEYQAPEQKRIKFMLMFIALVTLSAAGYFTYRALGPDYFVALLQQAKGYIEDDKPQAQQTKQVSVNSALDQMMPTRQQSPSANIAEPETTEEPIAALAEQDNDDAISRAAAGGETLPVEDATTAITESATDNPVVEPGTAPVVVDNQDADVSDYEFADPNTESSGPRPAVGPEGEPLENVEGAESFISFSDSQDESSRLLELSGKAAAAMQQENVSLAIRIYRQILQIDQTAHDTRKKLSVLHYSNGENEDAIVLLTEGIQLAPERTDFRLMLARLFYRDKQLKKAFQALEGIEPEVQQHIDYYGLKATLAQEQQLNAQASHLYGRLVVFEPNRAQWWLGLAISLDRLGQRDGALKAYENAAELRQLSASADDFIRQRILELGG